MATSSDNDSSSDEKTDSASLMVAALKELHDRTHQKLELANTIVAVAGLVLGVCAVAALVLAVKAEIKLNKLVRKKIGALS